MKTEILLGDTVKCKYTGIKGVVVVRSEFINGCIQFNIAQRVDPKLPLNTEGLQEVGVDSQSLIILKKGPRHIKKPKKKEKSSGGPMRLGVKARGF